MDARPALRRSLHGPALLWCALVCGLLAGCTLLDEPIGFRDYPLRDVPHAEALELVESVTRRFYARRFSTLGGFSLSVDADGRLQASPVVAGDRRMTLYLSLEPRDWGTNLAMLALVHNMEDEGLGVPQWGRPQQDPVLEQLLYQDLVAEVLRRRGG